MWHACNQPRIFLVPAAALPFPFRLLLHLGGVLLLQRRRLRLVLRQYHAVRQVRAVRERCNARPTPAHEQRL